MAGDAPGVDRTSTLLDRLRRNGHRRRPTHLEGTTPDAGAGAPEDGPDAERELSATRTDEPTWREAREALTWLRSAARATAAAYITLDLDGWVDSVATSDEGDADLHPRLLARARALFASGDLGYRRDDGGAALTWYADGALRAVIAENATTHGSEQLERVRSFLQSIESARASGAPNVNAGPGEAEPRPSPRPRLVDVITDEGRGTPLVTASLEWRGRSLVGSATAGPTEESLNGAAAMAVLRALDPATASRLRLNRFRLLGTDTVRLFVAAISVDDRVLTGAAAIEPGEISAGARAALAALNRELTRP
jgi:hypothetical protein